MQPFLVIQCLTEHVDTVLSYCVYVQKEVKQFKYYSQILLFNHTHLKPHLDMVVPYAFIEESLAIKGCFINSKYELKPIQRNQSLIQAKNINWKVQKERMKVLNLLKITG